MTPPLAIVVCGFCRSGTTMLYNMLRTTVYGYAFFDKEAPGASVADDAKVITKRPIDIFWQTDRRRIICIRDPRAVLTSQHWSAPGKYFCDADRDRNGRPGLLRQWRAIQQLEGERVQYEELVRDPQTVQARLGRRLGLSYVGHFADFWKHRTPERLEKALNGRRPLDKGHDWRDHMPRLRDQFARFPELHDCMADLGYAGDDSWLK